MYEDDAVLVAKVRSGSRDAFGTLVTRHYETALRAANRMVGEELCR